MIKIFGSHTSPFVRRVRIVALELDLAHELIDANTPEGQVELRARTPVWKVPVAEIDGALVFDSHVITELLVSRHGGDRILPLQTQDIEARNLVTVIDGALEALINAFYLARDRIYPDQSPYLSKQHDRAAASLTWLDRRAQAGSFDARGRLGLAELALGTALGWIRFREVHPLDAYTHLNSILAELDRRESFVATTPRG